MSRWDIERSDHVFANTTWIVGPIIRSRAIDTETAETDLSDEPAEGSVICPTCRRRFPVIAAACPDDGTPFTIDLTTEPATSPSR